MIRRLKQSLIWAVGALFFMTAAPVAQAQEPNFFITTSEAEWLRLVTGLKIYTEDFEDGTADGFTITSANDSIAGGELSDRIDETSSPASTTFSFSNEIWAFGGDWDLANPSGPGSGIIVTVDGFQLATEIPNSIAGTFWGFVSDTKFTNIVLTEGTQAASQPAAVENYDLDNVVFAIPEPASLAIFGIGLAGLGFVGRRRRKQAT